MFFAQSRHFLQINNSQRWVGGRFEIDQLSVRPHRLGVLIEVIGIHERSFDPNLGSHAPRNLEAPP